MNNFQKTTWRKVKLGEVADIKYGKDLPTRYLKESGYPVYGGNGIIGYSEKYLFEEPKVIVGCRGANSGNIFLTQPKSFITHNSLILDIGDRIDRKFFFYKLLSSHIKQQTVTGSAQPQITINELEQLEFNIPELTDQKRIASILSAFDDKIELNNKISRTLEEMAQAIFKEWFVKNAKFKNKNAKLEEIAKIIKGKKPQIIFNKSRSGDTEYLLIESFITNNRFFTNDDKVPQSEDGDTIIVMDGASSGRIFRGRKGAVGSTLAVIKPKQGISCEFLFLLLKHAEPQLMDNLTGSAIPHLDKYFLKTYPTSVPTLEIMEKFTYTVKSMLQKVVEIENENQKLAALRDLLLPKLMSGEIKV